ncbi:MAG: C69 family dipeptidase [Chitinophagales bacterium]|nr:C69 family dipeptidase [Chitinophagales bacterium]
MCDTFVCPPSLSKSGNWIFGKNSDREPNEVQLIRHHPPRLNTSGRQRCTYIEVDHSKECFATILSQPSQMWGAEMGMNEKGVAIGNEAVFTKIPFTKDNTGLTGMDMLRLALERSSSAKESLETIITLNEKYGQNANGGFQERFFYHNSFLIVDSNEAYVLETAGKYWAMEKVKKFRAISNGLSIGSEYDDIHPEAIHFAHQKGWSKINKPFHFAEAFSSFWMPKLAKCTMRRELLEQHSKDKFEIEDAFEILRSHQIQDHFLPQNSNTGSVCMHANGPFCPHQTTASMVVEIRTKQPSTLWLTGSSSPCLSIFKPFYFQSKLFLEDKKHWLDWEKLHRKAIYDYQNAHFKIETLRKEKENGWIIADSFIMSHQEYEKLPLLSKNALEENEEILSKLLQQDFSNHSSFLYRSFWNKHNTHLHQLYS